MENFFKTVTKFSLFLATSLMLISCGGSDSGSSANNDGTSANQPTEVKKPKIMYVCADGKSGADGLSWDTCTAKIQDAIKQGQDNGKDLWFKAGTYVLAETIILNKDTKLFGGFNGTEKELSDRKFENATILSGNKKIRVLKTENLSNNSILDGFVITHGKLTGHNYSESEYGAGMQNINSKITINNISFIENEAKKFGGAIYNKSSSPILTNVSFTKNRSGAGGAMYNDHSSPTITNASFSKNKAGSGGAIYNLHSHLTIINATFSEHTSESYGAAIFNNESRVILINTTFTKNTALYGIDAMYSLNHSNSTIKNSIIWENGNHEFETTEIDSDGISTSVISNSIIKGDSNNNGTQNPNLSEAKTKIVNGVTHIYYDLENGSFAIDKGENADNTQATDMIRNKRTQGAKIDMGAVEKQ